MQKARFPSTYMILPEYRQLTFKQPKDPNPVERIKNRQEFQRLLELSLRHGHVVQIICHPNKSLPRVNTGIVKKINPQAETLTLQTLEGPRKIDTRQIVDITCST
ncbi:MAG: hypothetical protein GX357_09305 [Firmicutes bacterium]|nr:hypothetical protein [Bacillota bacterium]